jgi:DNA-binding transcriptional LysR family regulator
LRRAQPVNIPTEILRTVAAVVETGSYTKAGESLNLSQPAISAQMKKFQALVGGSIFDKATVGVTLNGRGRMILPHIRALLELNDQILAVGGSSQEPRPPRLGLSDLFIERFLPFYNAENHGPVSIVCDDSTEVAKALTDGHVDIACVYRPHPGLGTILTAWEENFVWARSRTLTVRPGAAIPMVGSPSLLSTAIAAELLEDRGLNYQLTFTSRDIRSRLRAVEAGLGLMLIPASILEEPLIAAQEYYLPTPPSIEAAVVMRRGLKSKPTRLLTALETFSRSASSREPCAVRRPGPSLECRETVSAESTGGRAARSSH